MSAVFWAAIALGVVTTFIGRVMESAGVKDHLWFILLGIFCGASAMALKQVL